MVLYIINYIILLIFFELSYILSNKELEFLSSIHTKKIKYT